MRADRDWKDKDYKYREKMGCSDKVKHHNRSVAQKEAERLTIVLGKKMNAYKCPYCRFNTYHVGTSIESNPEPPKEIKVVEPVKTKAFEVLKPLAEAPKKSTKRPLAEKYPLGKLATEIIEKMDLYTGGKFPSVAPQLVSLTQYRKHYNIQSDAISAMTAMGYFESFPKMGTTLVIQPQEFHDTYTTFLSDYYDESVQYKKNIKAKQAQIARDMAAAKVKASPVKTMPIPGNDVLVVSKLKGIVKSLNELIAMIEGQ